ncbi:glutaminase [Rhodococcus phenolicus]|uniref:glutaminase n=1 Tax=Rhodococcus phenolicus TaxID=263849 RepID=UPI00082AA49C|nr:glutaminase [Rhodococcus phenolicus]
MKSPIPDYLHEVVEACSGDNPGSTADYIPELAQADPDRVAVCLSTVDGVVYSAGDADAEFSIQSISKPFVYALALAEHGLDHVLARVGVEPSGEAFNELSLDSDSGRPLNPMINAGALTAHALVGPESATTDERVERVLRGLSAFAGRDLDVDESVFESELGTAYRNSAIANMLRSYSVIDGDPAETVRGYTRQCAITVTVRDLAVMAATLANGGVQPLTGQRVVPRPVVRQVLSVMMTCGMYDAAGDWMSTVGIPAKSGVSGGVLGALPGQVGIGAFSPRLDPHGSSVRGVRMCTRLSDDMGLHIMDGPEPARSAIRRDRTLRGPQGHTVRVCSLQGTLQFSGAEHVLRALSDEDAADRLDLVVLDLRRVHSVNDVADRMLREAVRRLRLDGLRVTVVDPERVLYTHPARGDESADEVVPTLGPFLGYERVGGGGQAAGV